MCSHVVNSVVRLTFSPLFQIELYIQHGECVSIVIFPLRGLRPLRVCVFYAIILILLTSELIYGYNEYPTKSTSSKSDSNEAIMIGIDAGQTTKR